MLDFPFPQISPNVGGDGRLLLCLFYKPLKPTALSAVEAHLALAQRKLWEVGKLSGPARLRPSGVFRGVPLNLSTAYRHQVLEWIDAAGGSG